MFLMNILAALQIVMVAHAETASQQISRITNAEIQKCSQQFSLKQGQNSQQREVTLKNHVSCLQGSFRKTNTDLGNRVDVLVAQSNQMEQDLLKTIGNLTGELELLKIKSRPTMSAAAIREKIQSCDNFSFLVKSNSFFKDDFPQRVLQSLTKFSVPREEVQISNMANDLADAKITFQGARSREFSFEILSSLNLIYADCNITGIEFN